MTRLLRDIYIHLPVAALKELLPVFLEKHWQPEFALQTRDLDCMETATTSALKSALLSADLRCCIHAPFFDLNPASSDQDIRAITARRFNQTIDFAAAIEASRIVFHPGFDPWRYARTPDAWLNNSLSFWPDLLERARQYNLVFCLENIFDTQPTPMVDLLQAINSPQLRHCFDIGHWHLFSKTSLQSWFALLGPFLSHLHLHDNCGRADDHKPIGSGKIDFAAFFDQLLLLDISPSATLEAHTLKDAGLSLQTLVQLLEK